MSTDSEVIPTRSGGEQLYEAGMRALNEARKEHPASPDRTNYLLEALAQALLGALRSELDYVARQPVTPPKPEYAPPRFEEDDDDRP